MVQSWAAPNSQFQWLCKQGPLCTVYVGKFYSSSCSNHMGKVRHPNLFRKWNQGLTTTSHFVSRDICMNSYEEKVDSLRETGHAGSGASLATDMSQDPCTL